VANSFQAITDFWPDTGYHIFATLQQTEGMCAVVVSKTSCKDRNHPILRGVIVPHYFFFFAKIMIFLDFYSIFTQLLWGNRRTW
jgi:hypothetical protein